MNNVICLQRTEEICSHANVIAWIAVVAVVVVIFFSISMVSGLQMSNERKVVPLLERILLLLPSFFRAPRPATKINVCAGRPI